MKNIKDKVYEALKVVFGEEEVTDQYPRDWANLPAIQYTEEENRVHERTDKEEKAYVRYRIDIWHNISTSQAALEVDMALGPEALGPEGLGLIRTTCQDVPDQSGLKHKLMRYEGIIDMESDDVFWPNTGI